MPEAENNFYNLTEVLKYALADDGHWQMKSWQDQTQEIAEVVRNERTTSSLCSGVSSEETVGKPSNCRLNSLDRSSEIISDFLFAAPTSANSVLIPLRSDIRSEIVLWACSKLDQQQTIHEVDSIAERRSESLFSIDCRRLNTLDNCKASCPSGAWPVLFFLKVTPLLMSILIWIAVLYTTKQSITNFANTQIKSWTWQSTKSYPKKNFLTEQSPVGQCRFTNSWLQARLSWLKHVWSARRSVTE